MSTDLNSFDRSSCGAFRLSRLKARGINWHNLTFNAAGVATVSAGLSKPSYFAGVIGYGGSWVRIWNLNTGVMTTDSYSTGQKAAALHTSQSLVIYRGYILADLNNVFTGGRVDYSGPVWLQVQSWVDTGLPEIDFYIAYDNYAPQFDIIGSHLGSANYGDLPVRFYLGQYPNIGRYFTLQYIVRNDLNIQLGDNYSASQNSLGLTFFDP